VFSLNEFESRPLPRLIKFGNAPTAHCQSVLRTCQETKTDPQRNGTDVQGEWFKWNALSWANVIPHADFFAVGKTRDTIGLTGGDGLRGCI